MRKNQIKQYDHGYQAKVNKLNVIAKTINSMNLSAGQNVTIICIFNIILIHLNV